MTAEIENAPALKSPTHVRSEPRRRERYRAPFALRCGALLIDYILIALPVSLSTFAARLMGGGARMAGGSAEKLGIIITVIIAILDLGVLAGLRGQTVGKWTTGLRIERVDGRLPGIGRVLLRHFIGYPLSLLPFGLGFLIVTVSAHGRALHDLISGTVVVRDYVRVLPPRAHASQSAVRS
jgi:uncharacterized RDD family membrane protein YckC